MLGMLVFEKKKKKNQNQQNIGLGYFKTLKELTMQYMELTHKELVVLWVVIWLIPFN
jgi:hypothetical protein